MDFFFSASLLRSLVGCCYFIVDGGYYWRGGEDREATYVRNRR